MSVAPLGLLTRNVLLFWKTTRGEICKKLTRFLSQRRNAMSADRWSVCPQCLRFHQEGVDAAIEALEKAYGIVSANDFMKMKEALDNKIAVVVPITTLREDCEWWMDDNGKFTIVYNASCGTCGFKYEYNESDQAL